MLGQDVFEPSQVVAVGQRLKLVSRVTRYWQAFVKPHKQILENVLGWPNVQVLIPAFAASYDRQERLP